MEGKCQTDSHPREEPERTIVEIWRSAVAEASVKEGYRKHKQRIPVCSSSCMLRCVMESLTTAAPTAEPDSVAVPPLMKIKGKLSLSI